MFGAGQQRFEQGAETPDSLTDETIATRARALSSPVRWAILRACLAEPRTNKELADELGVNPGSMLHHVRTLVSAGFLAPGEVRRGARNAVEIPYRTTQLVWRAGRSAAGFGDYLLGASGEHVSDMGDADVWLTTIRTDEARRVELQRRMRALLDEYSIDQDGDDLREWAVVISVRPTREQTA